MNSIEVVETPDLFHLIMIDFDQVYEPLEDSILFLDVLEKDLKLICSLQPRLGLEVGCGSGWCDLNSYGTGSWIYLMDTDLNPFACKVTQQTAARYQTNASIYKWLKFFCFP